MANSFEQIRDQQKDTWNKFSPGWRKWDDFTMAFLKPMGDEIIAAIKPREADVVLDIATGTGEPGLSIAKLASKGKVIGTDLAEGMLETAEANARAKGVTNYSTRAADVSALPFPDGTFDAVSCRMGFMFFPDMALAAREMARVLKKGGRIATSVWSTPPGNPWVTTMMGVISRQLALPPPPADAPGMFRCAPAGMISAFFGQAGLSAVTEKEISGQVLYESADFYWEMMMEVAAPVVAAMSKADEATRAKIKAEVYAALAKLGSPISMGFSSRIISATKA